MEYPYLVPPFIHKEFDKMTKKEAKEYFEWYVSVTNDRINLLSNFIEKKDDNTIIDFSPKSLISLWEWYEGHINMVEIGKDQIEYQKQYYPQWIHDSLSTTTISYETLKYGLDISMYFGEVMVRNNGDKLKWGYFTSPKNCMGVNRPVILGYKNDIHMDPFNIVYVCTLESSVKKDSMQLYDAYNIWVKYI